MVVPSPQSIAFGMRMATRISKVQTDLKYSEILKNAKYVFGIGGIVPPQPNFPFIPIVYTGLAGPLGANMG
jgi:hypothetical protein